jgi:proteasome lid subunit RPN8/RPN11
MGMRVRISRCVVEIIQRAAAEAMPREACGLLFGSEDEIDAAEVTENVAENPERHFEIDPNALFAALKAERAGGRKLLGYWHSHPSGDVRPSVLDTQSAPNDGKLWLIVAGNDIAAWRLAIKDVLDQHEIATAWHNGELTKVARYFSSGATWRNFDRVALITGDLSHLRILGKSDVELIPLIIEAGYPAIAPMLDELVDWTADPNWPVAVPLMDYLATLGDPVIGPIQRVLRGDDSDHKYSCLAGIVFRLTPGIREQLKDDLERLAQSPTDEDRAADVDTEAREILESW